MGSKVEIEIIIRRGTRLCLYPNIVTTRLEMNLRNSALRNLGVSPSLVVGIK